MHVLIVDDEVGIREGVASFVKLRGHTVRTAHSVESARDALVAESFDAVVTDWRLGDEVAGGFLTDVDAPCLVMSGHPDDVSATGPRVEIVSKPILPDRIVAWIESAAATPEREGLPSDTAERVEHVRRAAAGAVEVLDDGEFVTLIGESPGGAAMLEEIASCGGDLRVFDGPRARFELRLYRDGRPDGAAVVPAAAEDWPAGDRDLAVDFDGLDPERATVTAVLDRIRRARACGRTVHALNVDPAVRNCVVALGRSDELPMRPMSGPRLPTYSRSFGVEP